MRHWEDPDRRGKLQAGSGLTTSLYKEVKRLLLETISRGEWKPGEAIPPERILSERFKVAVGTIRKAVDELETENILVRQQGRGTFVSAHDRDRMMFHFFHIVGDDGSKHTPSVAMLSFRAALADADEAGRLGLATGAKVFRIRNLLSLGEQPIIYDQITIPQTLFPGLTASTFKNRPNTIYHLYQTAFGITVVRTAERLRAVLADADASAQLDVAPGAPLLDIHRIAYSFNNLPVEYRRSLVDTEHHEYFSDLAKAG